MNYSTYRFTLDIHKARSQVSIPVMYQDTWVRFYINLTDGGKPYTLDGVDTAVLFGKKSDGSPLSHKCVISADKTRIEYTFNEQTASVIGSVACEIRLYSKSGLHLTTPSFVILVEERVIEDEDIVESVPDLSAIDSIFMSESEREEAEAARKEAEDGRADAETARVEAEAKRQELADRMEEHLEQTTDQEYNPESEKPQSGKAVAQAIEAIPKEKEVLNITTIDTTYEAKDKLPTDSSNGTVLLVVDANPPSLFTYSKGQEGKEDGWHFKTKLQPHTLYCVLTGEKSGIYRYTRDYPYLVLAEQAAIEAAGNYTDNRMNEHFPGTSFVAGKDSAIFDGANHSMVFGVESFAQKPNSVVLGDYLQTSLKGKGEKQTILGQYNVPDDGKVFIFAHGYPGTPRNLFTIDIDGNAYFRRKVNASDGWPLATEELVKTLRNDVNTADSAIKDRLGKVEAKLTNVTNVMDFVGVSSTDPLKGGATVGDTKTFQKGDVVLHDNNEYVYDGNAWHEYGNATALSASVSELGTVLRELQTRVASDEKDLSDYKSAHAQDYTNSYIDTLIRNVSAPTLTKYLIPESSTAGGGLMVYDSEEKKVVGITHMDGKTYKDIIGISGDVSVTFRGIAGGATTGTERDIYINSYFHGMPTYDGEFTVSLADWTNAFCWQIFLEMGIGLSYMSCMKAVATGFGTVKSVLLENVYILYK